MKNRYIVACFHCIIVSILVGGCEREKLRPDFSTPDNAVKSYWAFRIWEEENTAMGAIGDGYFSHETKTLSSKRRKESLEKFKNRTSIIEKVEMESESRAIVSTKERIEQGQKEPTSSRYILAKENGKWLIEDILNSCFACGGTGLDDDLETWKKRGFTGQIPQKTCTWCLGSGWYSFYTGVREVVKH